MTKRREFGKWAKPKAARLPKIYLPGGESLKSVDFGPPSAKILAAENERLGTAIDTDHKRRAEELGKDL